MRPCLFLERDGVINAAPPPGGVISNWDQFQLLPAVVDWIRLCNALDILVVVATNQPGVSRGLVSHHELDRIHANMRRILAAQGACIDDVFLCPHDGAGCSCAKPRPGMALAAAVKWKIDLHRSLLIGDPVVDRQFALRCGMRFLAAGEGRIHWVREAMAA